MWTLHITMNQLFFLYCEKKFTAKIPFQASQAGMQLDMCLCSYLSLYLLKWLEFKNICKPLSMIMPISFDILKAVGLRFEKWHRYPFVCSKKSIFALKSLDASDSKPVSVSIIYHQFQKREKIPWRCFYSEANPKGSLVEASFITYRSVYSK